MKDNTCNL